MWVVIDKHRFFAMASLFVSMASESFLVGTSEFVIGTLLASSQELG